MKYAVLLLLVASGSAAAGPIGNWIEFDYGRTELDNEDGIAPPTENESLQRVVGQTQGEQGSFIRYDLRRESAEVLITDPAELSWERRRDIATITIGRVVPLSAAVTLSAELGYGQVSQDAGLVAVTVDGNGDPLSYDAVQFGRKENTPLARMGFHGNHGGFTWTLEGEYLDEVPEPLPEAVSNKPSSQTWWNGRIGYDLGASWNIGVRYSDAEYFTATSLSLRWRT